MKSTRRRLQRWVQRHTSDKFYVRLIYYYTFLRCRWVPELLHLRNPKTWNEKIRYIGLNIDRLIPDAHLYADKLRVRDYVAEAVGDHHLVPLLGSWSRAEEIDWSGLPERFVLKANHGSGFNTIVRDRSDLDVAWATDQLNSWLETDYTLRGGGETHYRRIPPRLLAEELLAPDAADLPDYKFFCFDGRPEFACVTFGRHSDPRLLYMDMNWNLTHFKSHSPRPDRPVERPAAFDQMVSVAETLAAPFFFVTVDLYEVEGSVFFSELTFIPGGGTYFISPRVWNRKLGDLIRLPE